MNKKDKFGARLKRAAGLEISDYELELLNSVEDTELEPIEPVKQVEPCPKCYGERVEALLAEAYVRPIEFIHGATRSSVKVLTCTNCGYIELYAANPLNLVGKRPDEELEWPKSPNQLGIE
jgi:hypothetical protein